MRPKALYRLFSELAIALLLLIFCYEYSRGSTSDDAFIYMRYVRNLLAGNGYVYNVGEPSLGTTSIAWTLLMTGVSRLAANSQLVWKLSADLLFAATAFLVMRALRGASLGVAAVAAMFACSDPFSIRWSGTGMENALVVFSCCIGLLAFLQVNLSPTALRIAFLVMVAVVFPFVRPELVVFSLGIYCYLIVMHPRRSMLYLLAGALLALAAEAALFKETGFLLPQTGKAKAMLLHQSISFAPWSIGRNAILAAPGAILGVLLTWRSAKRFRLLYVAGLSMLIVEIVYFAVTHSLVSTRYSVVASSVLLIAVGLGLADDWNQHKRRLGVAALMLVQFGACFSLLVWQTPATRTDEAADIAKVGEWARSNLPAKSRIALTEIGVFGYVDDGYIIDLIGLTSPSVVSWSEKHGTHGSQAALEALLTATSATHYVGMQGSNTSIEGITMAFVPLGHWKVRRNNVSQGREIPADTWTIYELRRNPAGVADMHRDTVNVVRIGK